MNERIKELAEQAITEEHDGFRYFDKAKFAELLVKECMWQVIKDDQVPHDIQVLIGGRFKEHFGVEE